MIHEEEVLLQLTSMWQNGCMKRHYLDYAAATPTSIEVFEVMKPYFSEKYGNPSSIHKEGYEALNALNSAREEIARVLNVSPQSCIFTSSATESINLGIVGSVREWRKKNPNQIPEIIISNIEHDAVFGAADILKKEGVVVHKVGVNREGVVNITELEKQISLNTVLISVMYANNEIGTIQPIQEIAKIIRRWKKEKRGVVRSISPDAASAYPLLHTDATQATNYVELNIPRLGVDLLSCNSSKIYGPKGAGLLYAADSVALSPILEGGGQERGKRPGTESVALIVGFAKAFSIAQLDREKESERLIPIRDEIITTCDLAAKEVGLVCRINGGHGHVRLPNNINVSFIGVDHEYLAVLLDNSGFSVSTKSACNSYDAEISHVLVALNENEDNSRLKSQNSGIRFSLGRNSTKETSRDLREALPGLLKLALLPGWTM